MSVRTIYTCEARRCGNAWQISAVQTVAVHRMQLTEAGWDHANGHDYCPSHSGKANQAAAVSEAEADDHGSDTVEWQDA